jgi:GAF domain-containing protein
MIEAPVAASPLSAVGFSLRCCSPILTIMPEFSRVDSEAAYLELRERARALFAGENDALANAANLSALLFSGLPDLNWAGFYFVRGDQLVLGPFQGKVACVRIAVGKGVCGTAARRRETIIVPDVHAFPGHIACDAASQSEIVIPLLQGGRIWGVLDLDSPKPARFGAADAVGLESCVEEFLQASDLAGLLGRSELR